MDKVIIFDTTLRDGEQAAGAALSVQDKLDIARQLEKLGVDVIEAGFPISSPGDFEAVQLIAREIKKSSVCALAHANAEAVDIGPGKPLRKLKNLEFTFSCRLQIYIFCIN
jgi:2-isopropylmalate synthase